MLKRLENWLHQPIEDEVFRFFRLVFSCKFLLTAVWLIYPEWGFSKEWLIAILAVAFFLATRRTPDLYLTGFAVFLVFALWHVFRTLPFTLNHFILETFLILILLLFPARPCQTGRKSLVDGRASRLIQASLLTVWFYSGLQKIAHGYYLDGEMYALYAFFAERSELGRTLRMLLPVASFGNISMSALVPISPAPLEIFQNIRLPVSSAERLFLVSAGISTVVAEFLLPIFVVLFRSCRTPALILLILAQVAVGAATGELDFTMSGLVAWILFFPKTVRWSYPALWLSLWVLFLGRVMGKLPY